MVSRGQSQQVHVGPQPLSRIPSKQPRDRALQRANALPILELHCVFYFTSYFRIQYHLRNNPFVPL